MAAAHPGPAGALPAWLALLRWDKPSGRLILLIPAGWSLWLLPDAPPAAALVGWIVLGGLAVSAAGCIANDLWDRRIDPLVERTKTRPLADGRVGTTEAASLLLLSLVAENRLHTDDLQALLRLLGQRFSMRKLAGSLLNRLNPLAA